MGSGAVKKVVEPRIFGIPILAMLAVAFEGTEALNDLREMTGALALQGCGDVGHPLELLVLVKTLRDRTGAPGRNGQGLWAQTV